MRLSAGALVAQAGIVVHEPPAPTLGEQDHQVDEGETEAPDDDVLAGLDQVQVEVAAVRRRQVAQTMIISERGQRGERRRRADVDVAVHQDHGVGGHGLPVLEHHHLPFAGGGRHQVDRPLGVGDDLHRRRGSMPGPVVGVREVRIRQPSGREVHRTQGSGLRGERSVVQNRPVAAAPLEHGRPRSHRTFERDAVVHEGGQVLRGGVQPQQAGLGVPPHPTTAGWERVDQVHLDRPSIVGGRVADQALQQARAPRPQPDQDENEARRDAPC